MDEIITTNYDDLFELAAGREAVSVLPHAPRQGVRRWVLKMHGCVTHPPDIVLTREDYLRYEQRRVALAGMVQAMLLTRHMLFVGFSLNDENFHKVADAVRRALDPDARKRPCFGSVLKLEREPFVEELWRDELRFVPIGDELPAEESSENRRKLLGQRGRKLEIFLDHVLAHAPVDPSHFLTGRFSGALTAGERILRDELVQLIDRLAGEARTGHAWQHLCDAVRPMGGTAS